MIGALCGAVFKAPLTSTPKGTADWAAFCVNTGESCYVEPASDITVGNYTTPKESIGFQVTGLTPGAYDCYVATILPKTMVCSDAVSVQLTARSGAIAEELVAVAEEEPVANQQATFDELNEATFTEIPEESANPARFEELNQATFEELNEATFTEIPEESANPARFEELNQATFEELNEATFDPVNEAEFKVLPVEDMGGATFTELPAEDVGGEVTSGVATFTPLE